MWSMRSDSTLNIGTRACGTALLTTSRVAITSLGVSGRVRTRILRRAAAAILRLGSYIKATNRTILSWCTPKILGP